MVPDAGGISSWSYTATQSRAIRLHLFVRGSGIIWERVWNKYTQKARIHSLVHADVTTRQHEPFAIHFPAKLHEATQ